MNKTTTIHSSGKPGRGAMALRSPARLVKQLVRRVKSIFRRRDKYHPEKYYMRGPGPKWHHLQGDEAGVNQGGERNRGDHGTSAEAMRRGTMTGPG